MLQIVCIWDPATKHGEVCPRLLRSVERLGFKFTFTFTPNSRREFVPRDQVSPYFPFTLHCFYTKISSFMAVLTIGIVRDCFYLLIFYSEKFSTWVWRLPIAVNVNLNLSSVKKTRHTKNNLTLPTNLRNSKYPIFRSQQKSSTWQPKAP